MNLNDKFVLLAFIRQVRLQQLATGMLREYAASLSALKEEIIGLIMQVNPGSNRANLKLRLTRVGLLQDEIGTAIGDVMAELARRAQADLSDARDAVEEEEKKNWLLLVGAAVNIRKPVSAPLVSGEPIKDVFDKMAEDGTRRIISVIQQSVEAEQTTEEIVNRVSGESQESLSDLEIEGRKVEGAVRTAASGIPSEVNNRLETQEAEGIDRELGPTGWQHVSVMDSRTTEICRQRNGKQWDMDKDPIGHNLAFALPPLHPNCRSHVQWVFLRQEKATQMDFEDSLSMLTPAQRGSLFGDARIKRFEDGKITARDLVSGGGKQLTLEGFTKLSTRRNPDGFPWV